jgi:hypothetical protein
MGGRDGRAVAGPPGGAAGESGVALPRVPRRRLPRQPPRAGGWVLWPRAGARSCGGGPAAAPPAGLQTAAPARTHQTARPPAQRHAPAPSSHPPPSPPPPSRPPSPGCAPHLLFLDREALCQRKLCVVAGAPPHGNVVLLVAPGEGLHVLGCAGEGRRGGASLRCGREGVGPAGRLCTRRWVGCACADRHRASVPRDALQLRIPRTLQISSDLGTHRVPLGNERGMHRCRRRRRHSTSARERVAAACRWAPRVRAGARLEARKVSTNRLRRDAPCCRVLAP